MVGVFKNAHHFKRDFMKKLIVTGLLVCGSILQAYSTIMDHRTVTSAPLQFKQIDYSDKSLSFEMEAWGSSLFHPEHVMENLGINGQFSMSLNQQGLGDINPELILLGTATQAENYTSTMNVEPELWMVGGLFHFYKQWESVFFDIKTALLNCQTQLEIDELGGGNGGMSTLDGQVIHDALQAFTQSDWNYGKFGRERSVTGLDNIQLMLGSSTEMSSFSSAHCHEYFAGFILLEIPTGKGSQAEWLFEPRVGTNHWALGAGLDVQVVAENGFSLVAGGNYRYIFSAEERRSFDLVGNGQWSRYLGLQQLSEIGSGPVMALPGINLFTQDATIDGRSQVTLYARLQKRFEKYLFELSYNYFYTQQETISDVDLIASGFGVYNVGDEGGLTTYHLAKISQLPTPFQFDPTPVQLVTADLDLNSAAAKDWMSNTIAARLQRVHDSYTYGIGGSADIAASLQAISTWSVWFNFEVLLPN